MAHVIKQESGASLVEICLTVIIISITALVIMSFSRSIFGMSKDARGGDAAFLSAEAKITELSIKTSPAGGSDKDTIDNIFCDRSWVIVDTNNVKFAIVTVAYQTLKGTPKQIKLAGALQ